MTTSFAHLRVHSDYSLGRGASKIPDLVARAASLGQPALALTDEEAMHGVLSFSKNASGAGVQPIIGVKIFLPVSAKSATRGSVILLAQSELGYVNICRLLNQELLPNRPRVGILDREQLKVVSASKKTDDNHVADVIALAGCGADGLLGRVAMELGADGVDKFAAFLKSIFGDRLYIEICRNGHPTSVEIANERIVLETAYHRDIRIVGTSQVWYATPDRHDAYVILDAVHRNLHASLVGDKHGLIHKSPIRYHLRSADEMWNLFSDLPEAFWSATDIAYRCAFKVGERKPILPTFNTAGGRSEIQEMRSQALEGLERRLARKGLDAAKRKEYFDRLEYEMSVIEKMGFPGYFLIVSDFIKFAKTNDIPVGPARGSGAGSLVAWALAITDIDPLPFGLLFERFLNPDRVSMPDFDIDFCQDRRDKVIDYVFDKYGLDHVSRIVTYSQIKAKSALKDVARVLGHAETGVLSQMEINGLSLMVPGPINGKEKTLTEIYADVPDFQKKVDTSESARMVYENALKIEGLYRNSSSHAAGVVISGKKLRTIVPIGFDIATQMPMSQLDMKDSEKAGLVKFDFLGLKTLSMIKLAIQFVREIEGLTVDFDDIDYFDKPTLDIFATGRTVGIFQFESGGMRKALLDVGTQGITIEDLIAVNALYRPGPMEMIPTYASRKRGEAKAEYPDERTKPFLEETFGIIVYQEQVMQVARVVAGYSLGEADLLRRAMGKKIKSEMDAQRVRFVDGAVKGGLTKFKADEIFDLLAKFADYGFNKSHAAAYSVVAYQTAYLKAHHPVSFYSAFLSYENTPDKMSMIKQDMDEAGIVLLPPDINNSSFYFKPERLPEGALAVRFGLKAVKNLTSANIDPMIQDRESKGLYKTIDEFHRRVGRYFNSAQLKKLAECGALDNINIDGNRHQSFERLSCMAKNSKKNDSTMDIFGDEFVVHVPKKVMEVDEWPDKEEREKDSVGFFFKDHPLDKYEIRLKRIHVSKRQDVLDMLRQTGAAQARANLCGLVEYSEIIPGKEGRSSYLKVRISEKSENYVVKLYPNRLSPEKLQKSLKSYIKERTPIVLTARFKLSAKGDQYYIDSSAMSTVEECLARTHVPGTWELVVDPRKAVHRHPVVMALADLDARVLAGQISEEAGIAEVEVILNDTIDGMIDAIKSKLVASAKSSTPGKADKFIMRVILRAGHHIKEYVFNDIFANDHFVFDHTTSVMLCATRATGAVSFQEIYTTKAKAA